MRSELDYLGLRGPADLRMFRIASRRAYAPLLETGRINSDYFPFLEFGAARARFLGTSDLALADIARDPVPVLEMLSGFDAPELPQASKALSRIYPRFIDASRACLIADALAVGDAPLPPEASELLPEDVAQLRTLREQPLPSNAVAWQAWFASLFDLSKPMIPNGGAPALEQFLRSPRVSEALAGAPPAIREKVDFLVLVGRRDLDRIRKEGLRLLPGPMQIGDPGFHAYLRVAMPIGQRCTESTATPIVRSGAPVYNCGLGDAIGTQAANFTHHFLIAMPAMADPHFSHTLTYVCEHSPEGALGIVINKATDMTLSALFEQIDVPLADADLRRMPVHFGGPVQVDRGFVLHRPLGNWQSTLAVDDDVGLTTSKDVLEAVARGEGPKDVLVSLGYAGWSAGQLEQEIAQNAWLTVAADPGVLFETPVEARLPAAMRLLGIDFSRLSDDVGHA